MNKKIFAFAAVATLALGTPNLHAQELLAPPSLLDMIRQNEANAYRQVHQTDVSTNNSGSIPQNFNNFPNLSDGKPLEITYRKIHEGKAITISRANEAMLWVQEIDLSKGASLDSSLEVISYNEETGEPQFKKKSITETLSSLSEKPFSLINGQFFNPKTQPSELSFGLKQNDTVRTAGADNRSSSKNILRVNGQIAEIVPYSWENLNSSTGNFAMVNFTMNNKSYTDRAIGRTYMCLKNPDANNRSSKILTFVATDMTEIEIEREILKNGCTEASTSQLDSSGSSRLWYNDNFIFGTGHKGEADKRKIPHYITFHDAK